MLISYAQNHEDVVLARAFADQTQGFYVDIGAEHPEWGSVTKHFYDRGWRGINVEPSPWGLARLNAERPEDINLGVGIGDRDSIATLYEGPPENHGASTFSSRLAAVYAAAGQRFTPVKGIRIITLRRLFSEHVGDRTVDFLKIDVEGFEARVVAGGDWDRWRPRVVVVESTTPQTHEPTHHLWEPILLDAGYEFALFDGLNRFYVVPGEPRLRSALSYPACTLDGFVDARHLYETTALRERAEAAENALAARQAPPRGAPP